MKDVVTITRDKYRECAADICARYMKSSTKDPMFEAMMLTNNMILFMALEDTLFNNKEEN